MDDLSPSFLSKILRKRLEYLGYASLKKFADDRKEIRYSYELLRQVVYGGRVPRAETLLDILQAMRFSSSQIHKLMGIHYGAYAGRAGGGPGKPAGVSGGPDEGGAPRGENGQPAGGGALQPDRAGPPAELFADTAEDIAASLAASLPKIPFHGNDDFWEMARALSAQAERKVLGITRRATGQPLLFEKEPEAIYQFLLRRGKVPSYMSKGETPSLSFRPEIDYGDRFRGALLGAAAGETLGRVSQGLTPRDIRELFGKVGRDVAPFSRSWPGQEVGVPAVLLLVRALLPAGKLDPEATAGALAKARRLPGTDHHEDFVRNLLDRGFPWFEAGSPFPETSPAARAAPLALLRAGDSRLLKLETGIEAAVTHPHPAAIAGAIAQAAATARLLHTPAGTLDVLGFARGMSQVVSGIESDRSQRGKGGRPGPTIGRKLGTELTALLLRRAEPEEVQETLGNGASAPEGVPFAWACFLRHPDEYAAAVLAAVNLGNEAEANGAMAGSLAGAYVGASGIPEGILEGLPFRSELAAAADALLALARRDSRQEG